MMLYMFIFLLLMKPSSLSLFHPYTHMHTNDRIGLQMMHVKMKWKTTWAKLTQWLVSDWLNFLHKVNSIAQYTQRTFDFHVNCGVAFRLCVYFEYLWVDGFVLSTIYTTKSDKEMIGTLNKCVSECASEYIRFDGIYI